MKKIGIICRKKASDAALCVSIEKNFPDARIVQYQIPLVSWIPWIFHRIKKAGAMTLLGHLLLSTYLRLKRLAEKIQHESIWRKYTSSIPDWKKVQSKRTSCMSEKKLIQILGGVDLVVLLDPFRISHRVFRSLKVPFLEIIWGTAPEYMGDSGGFWAYALNDLGKTGTSIIEKKPNGARISILAHVPISCTKKENIRSIKIKQVMALQKHLPKIIREYKKKSFSDAKTNHCKCNFFYAPTIFTYLRFLKKHRLSSLPKYSHFQQSCIATEKK